MNILKLLTVPALFCLFSTGCLNPVEEPQMGEPKGQSSGSEVVGIKGRVLDGNGNPIEGAAVSLRKSNFLMDPVTKQVPPNSDRLTDNASLFHFDKVDTGEYFLTVLQDTNGGASFPVTISNADTLVEVEVQLEPLGSFTGGITISGSLRNIMPKYAQLFGTDYFGELIRREAKSWVGDNGFQNYSDFFIPNIPKGAYRFQLSDDGVNNCLALPSDIEFVIEPGKVSGARGRIELRTYFSLRGRTQNYPLKEADTARVFTEDFPIECGFGLLSDMQGVNGERLNDYHETRQMWFKSINWLHQGRVLAGTTDDNRTFILLEEGDVSSVALDSVVLQVENWCGTVTLHPFYLKVEGKKWEDEPYPELLDSLVEHYINSDSGVVYGVLPTISPSLTTPFNTLEDYWRLKAQTDSATFGNLAGYLLPALNRMTPDQKAAVTVIWDHKLSYQQIQDMRGDTLNAYLDSLSAIFAPRLESLVPGKAFDWNSKNGYCHSFPCVFNHGVLTKAEILSLMQQDFISTIQLRIDPKFFQIPVKTQASCSDSVKLALAESIIKTALEEFPPGIIYCDGSPRLPPNWELDAFLYCQGQDTLSFNSLPPKVDPTLSLLMVKMGESDSILVNIFPEISGENEPEMMPLPRGPEDITDSLAWAIYHKIVDSIQVENKKLWNAYRDSVQPPVIEKINQYLNRDISQCAYFKRDALPGCGLQTVLIKQEISLLANDAVINSIAFPAADIRVKHYYPIRRE